MVRDLALGLHMRQGSLDPLTVRERSERMSRIRSKDTKPEMRVRRLIHGLGYRYRHHASHLPGRLDLVFRPRRKVIFVHGCFWHRHEGCSRNRIPKSPERQEFWRDKLDGNARRDRLNQTALREMGWACSRQSGVRDQGSRPLGRKSHGVSGVVPCSSVEVRRRALAYASLRGRSRAAHGLPGRRVSHQGRNP